jgi:hypothetical protein
MTAAVAVLRERGELAEQPLGGIGFIRPGLHGDVGAQRLDLADRDLVRCSGPLHSSGRIPRPGHPKPPHE